MTAESALIILIVLVVWAVGLYWPGLYMAFVREILRAQPEARAKFIGSGAWIRFSRRFGRPYALGALALGMIWVMFGSASFPTTKFSFWLAFCPAFALGLVCAVLSSLIISRWIVDEA